MVMKMNTVGALLLSLLVGASTCIAQDPCTFECGTSVIPENRLQDLTEDDISCLAYNRQNCDGEPTFELFEQGDSNEVSLMLAHIQEMGRSRYDIRFRFGDVTGGCEAFLEVVQASRPCFDCPQLKLEVSETNVLSYDDEFESQVFGVQDCDSTMLNSVEVRSDPNDALPLATFTSGNPDGGIVEPLTTGGYSLAYEFSARTGGTETVTCTPGLTLTPVCFFTCGSATITTDQLETTTLESILGDIITNPRGSLCGEPSSVTFVTAGSSTEVSFEEIQEAGNYTARIRFGNRIPVCRDALIIEEAEPECEEPTRDDLICPDLGDDFLTTCDLLDGPVLLNFPPQTAGPSECAVPVTVEFDGCSICNNKNNKKKSYSAGCSVHEDPDQDETTNDFAIERVARDATYLKFIMKAGGVRKVCRYCVEKIPRGQCRKENTGKEGHLRMLMEEDPSLDEQDEEEEVFADRGLTGFYTQPKPTPRRDMTCRKNGKCKAPENQW